MKIIDRDILNKYIADGLLTERTHPDNANVCIYNYTNKCQFDKVWDEVTMKCRGLIIDWERCVYLSNPLPKFFNYEEHIEKGRPIPPGNPIVTQKYDGWYGILYWLNNEPWIATRGSFSSEGSIWATKWLRDNINTSPLNPNTTYLFEIISKGTKIVCDYDYEELVFLCARDIDGTDVEVPVPQRKDGEQMRRAGALGAGFDISYEGLRKLEEKNQEGFVLFWPSEGLRLKIKFNEYKRLHKIVTGLSAIGIWETLKEGKDLNFDNVPDEFFKWVEDVKRDIRAEYKAIEDEAKINYEHLTDKVVQDYGDDASRMRYAEKFLTFKNPGLLFAMFDNKPYAEAIWNMVRPHGESVFKKDVN